MEQQPILNAIQEIKGQEKKKFKQTYDLIMNLKGIDIKKNEEKVDLFLALPNTGAKKLKICALIDEALVLEAQKACDFVITKDEFKEYAKDKKKTKKLATQYSYFVTQPHLMTEVASAFGKILGPKGKMPNPKAGCIIPPKVAMQPIIDRLRKTIRVITKNEPSIKCPVGDETMADSDVADNAVAVYNAVMNHLPQKENNIKVAFLKTTMGSPVVIRGAK